LPAPKPLKGANLKFEQQSAIPSKWYEIGCQLVLIANRKSHIDTDIGDLEIDLERHNSYYFVLFHQIQ